MQATLQRIQKLGVPIGSIIDVGVNEATPQLMFSFPRHKHILIEPISDYFSAIRRNYAKLDYELIEAAAGDVDGVVHIASFERFGRGKVSHSEIVAEAGPNTREVPCMTLDSLIPPLAAKAPYLLKIDVEGSDVPAAILKGATQTLRQTSVVVIELIMPKFLELSALVGAAGFQVFDIVDACYYHDTLWQVDVVFIRNDIIAANPSLRPMSEGVFERRAWRPTRPIWERGLDKLRVKVGL